MSVRTERGVETRGQRSSVVPADLVVSSGMSAQRRPDHDRVVFPGLSPQLTSDPVRPSLVVLHRHQREAAGGGQLGAETIQQHRADPASELDHSASIVEDDVVAHHHEPARPHRARAPREVRPVQRFQGVTCISVIEPAAVA